MKKFPLWLYYLLQFTWGLSMTLVGLIVGLALLITSHKVNFYKGRPYFILNKKYSGFGVSLGFIAIVDKFWSSDRDRDWHLSYMLPHEYGHSIQNCLYGPFMIFLVSIPSVVRYWYRELKYYRKNLDPPTDYDSAWFEGQATKWGHQWLDNK